MNTPSSAVRPSHDTPHATPQPQPQSWLLVPALFTALTLAAGGLSYSVSELPRSPLWLSLPYLLPLGLTALTWRRPRTPAQRTSRIVAGSIGAGLALFCAQAVEAVLFCVALALWLIHGD